MGLIQTVAPTAEPISLKEVSDHLRVYDDNEAEYLRSLIGAARRQAETFCARQFITATWRYTIDDFPYGGEYIRIPRPRLQSVTSIKYLDFVGVQRTVDPAIYTVAADEEPGRVFTKYNTVWPVTLNQPGAVEIVFIAGYGDAPETVPDSVKHGMKLIIGNLYENREAIVVGSTATELPQSVKALLACEKVAMVL